TLSSCHLFQKQNQEPAVYDPYGTQPSNPYGQAAPNPYGQATSDPYGQPPPPPYGGYESGQASPYQQAPYVQNDPAPSGGYGGGGGGGSYTIQRGDTLSSIARRHNTTVSALKSANGLTTDLIQAGKTLRIP